MPDPDRPRPDPPTGPAAPPSAGWVQVVRDAEGGIRYRPDFVPRGLAQAWFDGLLDALPWRSEQRPMYDRVVAVPRLLAALPVADLAPGSLPAGILARVQASAPAPYNAIGFNLYRDGGDSVAMHGDKLHTLVPGQPIALLSLGAPRRMLVREQGRPGRPAPPAVALELAPGSLLVMSHAAQRTHLHGIPKTRRAVGPRISAVFRVRPASRVPE